MGKSEDYQGLAASDDFCTFEKMATYALQIAEQEGMGQFVSLGNLKGAHPALELAAAAGPAKCKKLVLLNPLILSPTAVAFINEKLIPLLRNQSLALDGSHLTAAWNDPSAAPFGLDGKPSAHAGDLLANEEKTTDELRCFYTGWQYDAAWTAYNAQNVPRMTAVDGYAESLFIYGNASLADEAKYGLDPQFSLDAFAGALHHSNRSSLHFLTDAGQGMAVQNATLLATMLKDFV